jgi:hypothetical protein
MEGRSCRGSGYRLQDAALVIAVEVDFHFGTVGQAVTVVFIQLIQDTGVPAKAPLITFQMASFIAVGGRPEPADFAQE